MSQPPANRRKDSRRSHPTDLPAGLAKERLLTAVNVVIEAAVAADRSGLVKAYVPFLRTMVTGFIVNMPEGEAARMVSQLLTALGGGEA